MIKLFAIFILFTTSQVGYTITYYQSNEKGVINKITLDEFNDCQRIIYRKSAKKELPVKHKKALLKALILGNTKNALDVATATLKSDPGLCSYTSDDEVME